jgi:DNA-binding transcriptional regulator YiaG
MSALYARDKAALHIGPAIQRARELVDVSAEELAGRLKVSTGSVCSWESGRSCPSVANLLRVAWALGVPMSRLVEDVE